MNPVIQELQAKKDYYGLIGVLEANEFQLYTWNFLNGTNDGLLNDLYFLLLASYLEQNQL